MREGTTRLEGWLALFRDVRQSSATALTFASAGEKCLKGFLAYPGRTRLDRNLATIGASLSAAVGDELDLFIDIAELFGEQEAEAGWVAVSSLLLRNAQK